MPDKTVWLYILCEVVFACDILSTNLKLRVFSKMICLINSLSNFMNQIANAPLHFLKTIDILRER